MQAKSTSFCGKPCPLRFVWPQVTGDTYARVTIEHPRLFDMYDTLSCASLLHPKLLLTLFISTNPPIVPPRSQTQPQLHCGSAPKPRRAIKAKSIFWTCNPNPKIKTCLECGNAHRCPILIPRGRVEMARTGTPTASIQNREAVRRREREDYERSFRRGAAEDSYRAVGAAGARDSSSNSSRILKAEPLCSRMCPIAETKLRCAEVEPS